MKLVITLSLLISLPGLAAPIDDDLAAAAKFTDGADAEPLKRIEQQVVDSLADAKLRSELEPKILAALPSASTRRGVDFLCRMLRITGTEKSIPALEKLLHVPESSHMARYVLASMRTDAASAALHRSLATLSGNLRTGIIDSLGDLRYAPATDDIAKLITDESCAPNAARALGLIGGPKAQSTLLALHAKSSGELRRFTEQGLLRCAETALHGGEKKRAEEMYGYLLDSGDQGHTTMAGLSGLVKVRGSEAVPLLVGFIGGEDRKLANGAVALIADIEGEGIGAKLKSLLESAPPDMQELLINSLAARGDRSSAPAIAALARSDNEGVRITAIEALGRVGDETTVLQLATIAAASSGHERNVARSSLASLRGDRVSAALSAALEEATPELKAELVRAIVARGDEGTVAMLFALAKSPEADVRSEALRGLRALVGPKHLPALLALLNAPADAADLGGIESAISAALQGIPEQDERAALLQKALTKANPSAKPALLGLLGRTGTSSALSALRSALKQAGASQNAAIKALGAWPSAEPAEDLLKIAAQSGNENSSRALEAYIAMAPRAGNPTAAYQKALALSDSTAVAKLVLAGLGEAGDAKALVLIVPFLGRTGTTNEAAIAASKVADRIKQSDAAAARAALEAVIASAASNPAKNAARKVLGQLK